MTSTTVGHKNVLTNGVQYSMLVYGAVNISSPAAFFRRKAFMRSGMLRKEFFFAMDYDLWLRMSLMGAQFAYLKKILGNFRIHVESKTSRHWTVCVEEVRKLRHELFGLDDRSFSFKVHRLLYRLKRIVLFILQGDAKYLWEGVRARIWTGQGKIPSSSAKSFEE